MRLSGPRSRSGRDGKEKNTLRNQQRCIAFGIIRYWDFGHRLVFEIYTTISRTGLAPIFRKKNTGKTRIYSATLVNRVLQIRNDIQNPNTKSERFQRRKSAPTQNQIEILRPSARNQVTIIAELPDLWKS